MENLLKSLDEIIYAFDLAVTEYQDVPVIGSIMATEIATYPETSRINDAFTFGRLNVLAGREQLSSMSGLIYSEKIFTNPVAARAVLESATLALWLLDPAIDVKERVSRGIIQLCDGKNQIRKFHREEGNTAAVDRINDFFDNRLQPLLDKNGVAYQNNNGDSVLPHKKKDNRPLAKLNFESLAFKIVNA
jgi:hypothetical protein